MNDNDHTCESCASFKPDLKSAAMPVGSRDTEAATKAKYVRRLGIAERHIDDEPLSVCANYDNSAI